VTPLCAVHIMFLINETFVGHSEVQYKCALGGAVCRVLHLYVLHLD
jgi:hypothetical protein